MVSTILREEFKLGTDLLLLGQSYRERQQQLTAVYRGQIIWWDWLTDDGEVPRLIRLSKMIPDPAPPRSWWYKEQPVDGKKLTDMYCRNYGNHERHHCKEPRPLPRNMHADVQHTECSSDVDRLSLADKIVSERISCFIDGEAGTGKTYFFTTNLAPLLDTAGLTYQCLAPTNRAAQNIDGKTLHRWFGIASGTDYVDEDEVVSDVEISPAFNNRSAHPDVYCIDEASMLTEQLWAVLHDIQLIPEHSMTFLIFSS